MKKRFLKSLSVMLSFILVVMATVGVFVTNGVLAADPQEHVYYIRGDKDADGNYLGNDNNDGKTPETAVKTIKKVVELANDVCGSDDTVVLKIVGSEAVTSGYTDRNRLPKYLFKKLIITANDTAVPGLITGNLELGGVTDFSYVTLNCQGTTDTGMGFNFGGYSATFGENTDFGGNYAFLHSNTGYNVWPPAPIDIKINQLSHKIFYLPSNYIKLINYKFPVTIEIDNWTIPGADETSGGIYLSNSRCKVQYHTPINIKIDNSNTRLLFKHTASMTVLNTGFAFQLINSTGKAIVKTGEYLNKNNTATSTKHTNALDKISKDNKFIIHNNTGFKDAITFTSVLGEYQVNLDPSVTLVATSVEDPNVYFESENGILKVDPGEYTLTRTSMNFTYFVSASGDDAKDGLTPDTAVKKFKRAVELANEVCGPDDTVRIYATGGVESGHNAGQSLPKYNFKKLIIAINPSATVTTNITGNFRLGGETEFVDIGIGGLGAINSNGGFYLGGYSATFGARLGTDSTARSVFFGSNVKGEELKTTGDINIKTDILYFPGFYLSGSYDTCTTIFDHPVTIEIGNWAPPKNNQQVGGFWLSYGPTTFNKPLNFKFDKSNVPVVLSHTAGKTYFGDEFALQIIDSTKKGIVRNGENLVQTGKANQTQTKGALEFIEEQGKPIYIIHNNTGFDDLVTFTSEVGKYQVNASPNVTVVATSVDDPTQKPIDAKGGEILELPVGEYNLTRTMSATYYIDADSVDSGDGSFEKPFATVAEAIKAAKDLGATDGSFVTAIVVGETTAQWGDAEDYTFDLTVKSYDTDKLSTVKAATTMTGDIEFTNINVSFPGTTNKQIIADGYNVTMGENVTADGRIVAAVTEGNYSKPQTITYKNNNTHNTVVGHYNSNRYITYNKDVNYILDNSSATFVFEFMAAYGRPLTFNQNLNFNVKAASSLRFLATTKEANPDASIAAGSLVFSEGRAAQVIMPYNTSILNNSLDNFKEITNHYIIKNLTTTVDDLLSFIDDEVAGKYAVKEGFAVAAYNEADELVASSADGCLDINDADFGTYNVRLIEANGRKLYGDIRDLVYVDEVKAGGVEAYNVLVDKDNTNEVNDDDIAIMRKERLAGIKYFLASEDVVS